jgi:hypothetical protein
MCVCVHVCQPCGGGSLQNNPSAMQPLLQRGDGCGFTSTSSPSPPGHVRPCHADPLLGVHPPRGVMTDLPSLGGLPDAPPMAPQTPVTLSITTGRKRGHLLLRNFPDLHCPLGGHRSISPEGFSLVHQQHCPLIVGPGPSGANRWHLGTLSPFDRQGNLFPPLFLEMIFPASGQGNASSKDAHILDPNLWAYEMAWQRK